MKTEQSVSVECRLLDELVDDTAAPSPGRTQFQRPGKAEVSNRLLPELTDDAAARAPKVIDPAP